MKLLTGLFRMARKRLQTADSDMGSFRDKLTKLVEGVKNLTDEGVAAQVEELKRMAEDLPDSEDKAKLERFLEDFKAAKEQDEATLKNAVGTVADLYEKLDAEAMKDIPSAEQPAVEEPAGEPAETVEETVEETVAPEGKPEDAGPNAGYTLEEIYQYIKKRMAEDAAACDGAEEVEKKEEEKVVKDGAPRISVTMNGTASAASGLNALFETIKGGR